MKLSKSKYLKFFPITKNGQFLLSCATKEEKGKKKKKKLEVWYTNKELV